MKKISSIIALFLIFLALLFVDYSNSMAITKLTYEVRVLGTNNIQLIQLNEYLSERIGDMADIIIEKAEWDKQVAERLREQELFNRTVSQRLIGYTNETKTIP